MGVPHVVALDIADGSRLNDQPKATKGSGKKPAAAPFGASKKSKSEKNPLFEARPKNFGIGKFGCHGISRRMTHWFRKQARTSSPRPT